LVASHSLQDRQEFHQPPKTRYERVVLGDFLGYVSPSAKSRPQILSDTLELLKFRLRQVKQELPPADYRRLTGVEFWIETNDPKTPAAVYHPSADWLKANGYNPQMARNIEIGNMVNFLKWQHIQPSMVLHELSHAFQFKYLGADYEPIDSAYKHALATHLYESVPFVTGGRRRAYALTNRYEYFAECSEAYFGRNDFYPFLRYELKSYDPVGYTAVEMAWGISK
jgi:hypothetical protein